MSWQVVAFGVCLAVIMGNLVRLTIRDVTRGLRGDFTSMPKSFKRKHNIPPFDVCDDNSDAKDQDTDRYGNMLQNPSYQFSYKGSSEQHESHCNNYSSNKAVDVLIGHLKRIIKRVATKCK